MNGYSETVIQGKLAAALCHLLVEQAAWIHEGILHPIKHRQEFAELHSLRAAHPSQ
jgi:hypothetical protein